MKLVASSLAAFALAGASNAGAQPSAPADPAAATTPMEPQAGVASAQAVDPAPGAHGPYVGHSENAFYDVDARITRVQTRVDGLTGAKKLQANNKLSAIKSELATQKARHGSVRDWDRENINKQLDKLETDYSLGAQAVPAVGPSS